MFSFFSLAVGHNIGSVVVSREVVHRVGGFPVRLEACSDLSAGFLLLDEFVGGECWYQPLNHSVKQRQAKMAASLLKGGKVTPV